VKVDRGKLLIALVAVLTAASAAVPLFVDGWWLDLGMPGRLALAVSCPVSVAAGMIARSRRPDNRFGIWLVISGLSAPLGFIVGAESPLITLASGVLLLVAAGTGAALPISFPSGRLDGRAPAALAAVVVTCAVYRTQQIVLFDPVKSIPGWTHPNQLYVSVPAAIRDGYGVVYSVFGTVFLLVFGFWLARRWRRLSGPARLSIAPVLAGALVFVATSLIQAAATQAGVTGQALDAAQFLHTMSFCAVPIGFLAGLMRVRMARSAIADLVVELGETPDPAQLRRALATALGDPTLEVALWSAEAGAFVDASLTPLASLEAASGGRAITLLERDGAPLAAILHDPALLEDPGLVASVATAVRLTVENDRLQDEVRAQLAEVRASRARIVEATDAERRRIERDIHDGAQQRLVALSLAIGRARGQLGPATDPALAATLAQASAELSAALSELRELARGIHPAILTQAGLEPAVRSLVDRAAVPTDLDFEIEGRLPPAVEAAAYFVVSEALTNVAKHSAAAKARVRVLEENGSLIVEICDDGCGGADPARGSGLRGLRDRVEAIGGTLAATGAAGGGTTIRAAIPVEAVR
jgi:signal transduction histidine kinase